jgi:PAS domain S-box-containing protein
MFCNNKKYFVDLLKRNAVAICLLLSLLPGILFSQNENYYQPWRWVKFTSEFGLPSNYILDVIETEDGTVWAATTSGVAYYDGFLWHALDQQLGLPGKQPVLIERGLHDSLLVIIDGALYSGTRKGFRKLPLTGVLAAVPLLPNALLVESNNNLYVVKDDVANAFPSPESKMKERLPFKYLRYTKAGNVWACYGGEAFRLEGGSWKQVIHNQNYSFELIALVENLEGDGIAAFRDNWKTYEWRKGEHPKENESEYGAILTTLDISPNGEVMSINLSGAARIRRSQRWQAIPHFEDNIRDIIKIRFRDNGDLWVCTQQGLYLCKLSSNRWINRFNESAQLFNFVNDILFSSDGNLWLATAGGLEIIHPDGTSTLIDHADGQSIASATGLAEDRDKNIWVVSGSGFTGAYQWDATQWKHINIGNDTNGIYFHKISKDPQEHLWFLGLKHRNTLTFSNAGAFEYADGRFRHLGVDEGLLFERVYAFKGGRDGTRWFGTLGGLCRWKDGAWTYWNSESEIQINKVYTIENDRNNTLWFSNGNGGACYFDSSMKAHYLTMDDGLVNNNVTQITSDDAGRIWLATMHGLSCYWNGVWANFDNKNGLSNPNIWPIVVRNNKIYIGTIGSGLVILDLYESSQPRPKVFLDAPFIDKGSTFLRWRAFSYWGMERPEDIQVRFRFDGETWSRWSAAREITQRDLSSGVHSFEIQTKNMFGMVNENVERVAFDIPRPWYQHPFFIAVTAMFSIAILTLGIMLYLRKRKHNLEIRKSELRFRRLTDAAFEGIVVHTRGIIIDANKSFLGLLSYSAEDVIGTSVFRYADDESQPALEKVIERDHEDPVEAVFRKSNGSEVTVEIISKTIPYENETAAVLALRDITERKIAEKNLLQYQQQLRSLASELSITEQRERENLATYLHDQIGHTLALVKMKLKNTSGNKLQEELGDVHKLIEQTIANTRSLTVELSPPLMEQWNLAEAIEWLVDHFQEQHAMLIYYEHDHQPIPIGEEMKRFLYHAVRELLVNIIKHSHANSAEVILRHTGSILQVEVKDDGVGFDPSTLDVHPNRKGGFGLFNIRERLGHYHGSLTIMPGTAGGVVITLNVPLDSESVYRGEVQA